MVPQALLDQYLSMTDPSRAQTVDTEIAKHCAYSLPGVALTLGRQNWHCLRETYETLASDMQVRGRRPNLGAGAQGAAQRVSLRVQAPPSTRTLRLLLDYTPKICLPFEPPTSPTHRGAGAVV